MRKTINSLGLITLLLLSTSTSRQLYAGPTSEQGAQASGESSSLSADEVELRMKVTDAILQSVYRASQAGETLADGDVQGINELKASTRQLVDLYVGSQMQIDFEKRTKIQWVLDHLKWEKILEYGKHAVKGIRKTARVNGRGAAIGFGAGFAFEFISPVLCTVLHVPFLIPVLVAVPEEPVGAAAFIAVDKWMMRRRMIEAFQGKEGYGEWKAAQKAMREQLKYKSSSDFLYPIETNGNILTAAVVSESKFLTKFLRFFGFTDKKMDFGKLAQFCRDQNLDSPWIKSLIEERSDIPKTVRAVYILDYLGKMDDPRPMMQLKATFSESFVQIRTAPGNWNALLEWSRRIPSITHLSEVPALMASLPKGTDPKLVAKLWKDVILPRLVDQVGGVSIREFRSLLKTFPKLLAEIETSSDRSWDENWAAKFASYLSESIKESGSGSWCGNIFGRLGHAH